MQVRTAGDYLRGKSTLVICGVDERADVRAVGFDYGADVV